MSDDDPGDLFDTDNVVVCQFDKVCSLGYIVEVGLPSQGRRSGESTRVPPIWPGFDFLSRCHIWVEFVGSLYCSERFFPAYSDFLLSPKIKI